MDITVYVLNGFLEIFQPFTLLMMVAGLVIGIVGGMLPGINSVTTLALFVPFTFTMSPYTALISLGSIYMGSIYGGSIASILINTPGQASNIVTAMEGYPMTLRGESRRALDVSISASAFGGVFGGVMLLLFFEPLSSAALKFGSEAFFWMGIFGLSALATLFPGQVIKSLMAGFIGMAISTIGMDQTAGLPRFTMGYYPLIQGLDMVVVMIGIFSISQMFTLMESNADYIVSEPKQGKSLWRTLLDTMRRIKLLCASSMLGSFIGIMPGTGGTVAAILAYNEARRFSKTPEKFGTGIDEGIIAPESANNASVGGALVPLLAIGIPGSASAAVIVGGLMAQGITPGPQLLAKTPDIAYAFILSIIVCSIVMVPAGWLISRGCVRMLDLRRKFIIPAVITLSCVGGYAIRNSMFDVNVVLLTGAFAYVCIKAGIQPASMALGLVLGPIVEENLVITMMRARATHDLAGLLIFSPLAMLFMVCSILVLSLPFIMGQLKKPAGQRGLNLNFGFNTKVVRRFDFWMVLFIVLGTIPFIAESFTFQIESRIYPVFVYFGIMGLGLLSLLGMTFFEKSKKPVQPFSVTLRPCYVHIAICFALCVVAIQLVPVLGFYTSMFGCMLLALVFLTRINPKDRLTGKEFSRLIAASLITVVLEYICFNILLKMETPSGFFL